MRIRTWSSPRGVLAIVFTVSVVLLATISLPTTNTPVAHAATTAKLVKLIHTGSKSSPLWAPNTSPDPSGITYWSSHGNLVVVDGEVEEMAIFQGANMFESTLRGELVRTWNLTDFNTEPVGVDIDIAIGPNGTIFISNDSQKTIFEIKLTSTGDLDRRTLRPFLTSGWGNQDPEGLTLGGGKLYTVDGSGAEVYITSPGSNGIFEASDPTTHWDTAVHGIADPEGIEYDPRSGTLWIIDRRLDTLSELTVAGALLRQFDLRPELERAGNTRSELNLADVTIADGNFYIVDRGVDNNNDPTENDGKIYEFTLVDDGPSPSPTNTPTATSTPTSTPTDTPTSTPTDTPTGTPTGTPTDTPTDTPNHAPVAVKDTAKTRKDTAVTIPVLANDTDADADPLSVANVTAPARGGVAEINLKDNTVIYTPQRGFTGKDSFTYTANDGTLDSNPATVTVQVTK